MDFDTLDELVVPADSTIVLLVLDGVGGLGRQTHGPTELEAAETPMLDDLAAESVCGLQLPVGPGISPGSGPGHLGLFGYDPLDFRVGRGVLSALGIDFDLQPGDVAARGNFCTVEDGVVTDRRAGRISTEANCRLTELLDDIELPGADVLVRTVKEHRFLLVLRGDDLDGDVSDTDPHEVGRPPQNPRARSPRAERTADLIETFVDRARDRLGDVRNDTPANMVLMRGFDQRPDWPRFPTHYGLDAACIANYPMYRGVSRLVGMQTLDAPSSIGDKFDLVGDHVDDFDFFFVHEKRTDSLGEDGDFEAKVDVLEEVDSALPRLLDADPDVVMVTGDHSTPAAMKRHSWHPVPVLLNADNARADGVEAFGESACRAGELGPQFRAADLMPLALANAGRLTKFGA